MGETCGTICEDTERSGLVFFFTRSCPRHPTPYTIHMPRVILDSISYTPRAATITATLALAVLLVVAWTLTFTPRVSVTSPIVEPFVDDWSRAATHATPAHRTIFVSIPSYRDTNCSTTLKSLFANAQYPKRVFVGLYEQNDLSAAEERCTLEGTPFVAYEAQIRRVRVAHTEAKGPLWARKHIFDLYRDETYYMMIDAHTLFLRNWDTRLTMELDYLHDVHGVTLPILSTYPHNSQDLSTTPTVDGGDAFIVPDAQHKRDSTTTVCDVLQAKHFPQVLHASEKPSGQYYRTPFVSAGYLFTYGRFCSTLRTALRELHLPHVFSGEEVLIAAIAYTNGWDVYAPPYVNVFHKYNHDNPIWSRDQTSSTADDSDRHTARAAEQLAGETRLREVLDSDENHACLGTTRSLGAFWKEMGFRRHRSNLGVPRGSVNSIDAEEADTPEVSVLFPATSKDKWCLKPETKAYPLVEPFVNA